MKKIFIVTIYLFAIVSNAQSIWQKVDAGKIEVDQQLLHRQNNPIKGEIYALNNLGFKQQLSLTNTNSTIIELPNTEGILERFVARKTSYMSSELAKKYPAIQSYTARGIDDTSAIAKISIGTDGIHVMIQSNNHKTLYIDPYSKGKNYSIAYKRNIDGNTHDFKCNVEEHHSNKEVARTSSATTGVLKTYRLALACTGEYAQFHLKQQNVSESASEEQKKEAVLSAINTTITRVNSIYERDLSVSLKLVDNNDAIIFLDPETDNYTDGKPREMLKENQRVCDNIIGSANYDIGHLFSVAGEGLAWRAGVCRNDYKARGVTGRSQPYGDAYDIDYVCHEMGHQFGAYHTQNNNCNSNRNKEVEPGSGSTIMGYAGICEPNIQQNSDAYFHSASIAQMKAYIATTSCATITNTNNQSPTVNAGNDYIIPKSTPFILKGEATDSDTNANLTYTWEQFDTGSATMPPIHSSKIGPLFRSLLPSTSPNRYMPSIENITNETTMWEVLPSVARELNFALTVRDNQAGGGETARDDMRITVDASSGPFEVTSQKTKTLWNANELVTVTWDVANTDQAPINAKKVTIKLSTDGGKTFPITLGSEINNNGQHMLRVPKDIKTEEARIIVEASNNIFFNINKVAFSIDDKIIDNSGPFNNLKIYPNPSNGIVNIMFEPLETKKVSIRLFDMRGRMVQTRDFNNVDLLFSKQLNFDVSQGVYILQIENKGEQVIKKIIIR